MKIMYVEDNQANISLLQRIARMGGHEVINYTNGETALSNFATDAPDLVLMDLQLEGRVSGLDVVKQLRARGFITPIVAVTAYAMVGDRERCIEAGCNSYLSKPLPVAELVELVKDYEQKSKPATPAPTPEVSANGSAHGVKESAETVVLPSLKVETLIAKEAAEIVKAPDTAAEKPQEIVQTIEVPITDTVSEEPADEPSTLKLTEEPTEPSKDPKLDLSAAPLSTNPVVDPAAQTGSVQI